MIEMTNTEYCLIGIDNIEGLKEEIGKHSIDESKFIESKSILVCRFRSNKSVWDLNKALSKIKDRTFFIFELSPMTSAVHIGIPKLHNKLFSDFDEKSNRIVNDMNNVINMLINGKATFSSLPNDVMSNINSNSVSYPSFSFRYKIAEHNVDNTKKISTKLTQNLKYDEVSLIKLSKLEKSNLIDDLLKKGTKLTTKDKKILNFLAKNS